MSLAAELAAAAGSLDALRNAMAGFEGSPLRETATNLVFADGVPGSGLMVTGEAPGADEDRLGKPFVGADDGKGHHWPSFFITAVAARSAPMHPASRASL